MLTREQAYAAKIYAQVISEIAPMAPAKQKKYGSMAHKLPVLIRVAGLAQALQFVESRGSNEHRRLLKHLALTLDYTDDGGDNAPTAEAKMLAESRTLGIAAYMHLTQRALTALQWYKRFAQSVLKVEAGDQADNIQ